MMNKRTSTLSAADRASARYNLLTTGQVAERLSEENVDGDTVRSWCEEEEAARRLKATDGRRKDAKRPFWLIDWSDVEEFLQRRSNAA